MLNAAVPQVAYELNVEVPKCLKLSREYNLNGFVH